MSPRRMSTALNVHLEDEDALEDNGAEAAAADRQQQLQMMMNL